MIACGCGSWRWIDAEERWEFWPSGTRRRKVRRCGYCGDTLKRDGTIERAQGENVVDSVYPKVVD